MSKGKQLAYSSRTVQCPHTALHSNGGMGPNLHKKPQWVLWQRKKERKKHNVDLAASRQTALSLSPLGMLGPQWGLTGWKSILCETPQWLRGLENVARDYSDILAQPSVAFETLCRANTRLGESCRHGCSKLNATRNS